MGKSIPYGDSFIQIQSFELTRGSDWIPRFTLLRRGAVPLSRDRLDKVFRSKEEADEFALEDAMEWIDQN